MTDVNEPPAFDLTGLTTDANGVALFTLAENTTAVGTVAAADPDAADTDVTYALSGTDAGLFSIGADGAIAFKAAPDFEDPKGGALGRLQRPTAFRVLASWLASALGQQERVAPGPGHRDRRERRGAREARGADGGRDRGVADQPRRALDRARQRRSRHHGLRRAVPPE